MTNIEIAAMKMQKIGMLLLSIISTAMLPFFDAPAHLTYAASALIGASVGMLILPATVEFAYRTAQERNRKYFERRWPRTKQQ